MARFTSDQLSYAAGLRGYLDRQASLDFLRTMDIRLSVGHWSAGDFCDRFAPPGYHSDDPQFQNDFEGQCRRTSAAGVTAIEIHQSVFEKTMNGDVDHGAIDRARDGYLAELGMTVTACNINTWTNPKFRLGGPCNPNAALRRAALDEMLKGVEICKLLKIPVLSVWPGSDGADYHFQIDYLQSLEWFTEALVTVNKACLEGGIKLAIEPKPYEPRELYMIIPTAASAILVAERVNRACGGNNCGLTIDYGHQKMEATTASTSCDLAAYAGVPVHKFDINDARQGRNDQDLMFGTVSIPESVEYLYTTFVRNYRGFYSQDQFTYREDPTRAIERSMINFANLSLKAVRVLAEQPRLDAARSAGTGPDVLDVVSPGPGRMISAYTIGIDFGTSSARAIVVDCRDGRVLGTGVHDYPSGDHGVLLAPRDPHLARQNPADYLESLDESVGRALADADCDDEFSRTRVIGIGVDTTGSTPMPIDEHARPLALDPVWRDNLAAHAWLWKDHTSAPEAAAITDIAKTHAPEYLATIGGTYSSEWWWSKIWRCLKGSPEVFDAAASWVELADFIPATLAGVRHPRNIVRCVCAAGHKAMYSRAWGGLPSKAFLTRLDPKLAALRDRLYDDAFPPGRPAGRLSMEWADRLGLPEGIAIAMGGFDAHYGAVGSGIQTGTLVKIIGTSTCDCAVSPVEHGSPEIPGICGVVSGSILPGYYGLEAGQSAVGDILNWWVESVCEGSDALHDELSRACAALRPGESGLLALDWNNGNRTVLVDPRLTGLLVGQTLHSTRAEIYRALIEGTAFGARTIIERIRAHGVPIERVVCCGGIAEKNDTFMQIYADVIGQPMLIAGSPQAPALGAALSAAVTAGGDAGGYDDWSSAQRAMTSVKAKRFDPNPESHAVYDRLFALYSRLHDAFGGVNRAPADLGNVMKELLSIRDHSG